MAVEDKRAAINITYNYRAILVSLFGDMGIRSLYNMTAKDSIPLLEEAITKLGDQEPDPDYWAATEGNVKVVLEGMLFMANNLPDGVWDGDQHENLFQQANIGDL